MVSVDPHEFDGRVALVTAAAGAGIGQAVARRLAAGGARVVVTDIHERRTRPSRRRSRPTFRRRRWSACRWTRATVTRSTSSSTR